jgi:hypothetical protein
MGQRAQPRVLDFEACLIGCRFHTSNHSQLWVAPYQAPIQPKFLLHSVRQFEDDFLIFIEE